MNSLFKKSWKAAWGLCVLSSALTCAAQPNTVNAICSTDQSWCEMAAQAFTKATGITVLQTRKATGEALAQIRAEAANPKTDIWWGGTGDPFLQAAEIGLLTPYRPAYINDLYGWSVRQYAMSENKVGGFYTSAIGFGYTRSGTAQAPNVAKGEVAVGVSFMFGFDLWKHNKYPVQSGAPCEGTSYEIGGIALIKGARNAAAGKQYYDWLMSADGQKIGGLAGSLQFPANKTFKPDARIPTLDDVRLIKYDFEKYGKAAERRRLLERWNKEVGAQAR